MTDAVLHELLPRDVADLYLTGELAVPENDPAGRRYDRGPLPREAVRYYTSGGCFDLAVALHQLSGLPLGGECQRDVTSGELIVLHHAFVLDDGFIVDAGGHEDAAAGLAMPPREDAATGVIWMAVGAVTLEEVTGQVAEALPTSAALEAAM